MDTKIAKIKIRRGKDAERQTTIFDEGELAYTTDTQRLVIGDNKTIGGIPIVKNFINEFSTQALCGDFCYNDGTLYIYINNQWVPTSINIDNNSGLEFVNNNLSINTNYPIFINNNAISFKYNTGNSPFYINNNNEFSINSIYPIDTQGDIKLLYNQNHFALVPQGQMNVDGNLINISQLDIQSNIPLICFKQIFPLSSYITSSLSSTLSTYNNVYYFDNINNPYLYLPTWQLLYNNDNFELTVGTYNVSVLSTLENNITGPISSVVVTKQLTSYQLDINSKILNQINNQASEISNISTQINNQASEISNISTQINNQASEISSILTQINTLFSMISSLTSA